MSRRPRYVAQGFVEDVTVLMNDFLKLKSLEFRDFASVWRKNHFSLIFMGRPDDTEMDEFVNEMYRITSQYLLTESFNQQVGSVYILYALFRNQISEPPIKIRIELNHWKGVNFLRNEAIEKKYLTLHYVIDFLMDNAFLYVFRQTLRGPCTTLGNPSNKDVVVSDIKGNFKDCIERYFTCNKISLLRDIYLQYAEEKKKICDGNPNSQLNMTSEIYEEARIGLEKLIEGQKGNEERNAGVACSRRATVSKPFELKPKNIRSGLSEVKEAGTSNKNKVCTGARRSSKDEKKPARKEDRRVGRPKKKQEKEKTPPSSEEEELDITHLLDQQKNFYLPPVNGAPRKARTVREPYYELHPRERKVQRRSDSDSD